jgi:hypothetical protein
LLTYKDLVSRLTQNPWRAAPVWMKRISFIVCGSITETSALVLVRDVEHRPLGGQLHVDRTPADVEGADDPTARQIHLRHHPEYSAEITRFGRRRKVEVVDARERHADTIRPASTCRGRRGRASHALRHVDGELSVGGEVEVCRDRGSGSRWTGLLVPSIHLGERVACTCCRR